MKQSFHTDSGNTSPPCLPFPSSNIVYDLTKTVDHAEWIETIQEKYRTYPAKRRNTNEEQYGRYDRFYKQCRQNKVYRTCFAKIRIIITSPIAMGAQIRQRTK